MTEPTAVVQPADPGLFRFCIAIPIRYDDIDAQRHLNNVSHFVFMQQARLEYLLGLGLWNGTDFEGVGMILREATCSYHAPAYLGETVRVWTRVSHLGTKSFHIEYRFETQRGEIATGRSVQVCYDWVQGRSIPMPAAWRAAILAYEPAPARPGPRESAEGESNGLPPAAAPGTILPPAAAGGTEGGYS